MMGIFTHCKSCLLTEVQFWGNLQVSCHQEHFVKVYNECYCFPYMKPWNSRQSGRLSTLYTQNCCLFPLQHFLFFFSLKKAAYKFSKKVNYLLKKHKLSEAITQIYSLLMYFTASQLFKIIFKLMFDSGGKASSCYKLMSPDLMYL